VGHTLSMDLRLRPLRLEDERSAVEAHRELEHDDFEFLLGWRPAASWAPYIADLEARRHHTEVTETSVPATFLAAVVEGDLVGRVSVRHTLNAFLAEVGGHVGYGVRPRYRQRGYATEILRQALVVARANGVEDVLVTCDEPNVASARVIERLGGVLEDVRRGDDGILKRRYWFR
jgi:predicted acetyltransferase